MTNSGEEGLRSIHGGLTEPQYIVDMFLQLGRVGIVYHQGDGGQAVEIIDDGVAYAGAVPRAMTQHRKTINFNVLEVSKPSSDFLKSMRP